MINIKLTFSQYPDTTIYVCCKLETMILECCTCPSVATLASHKFALQQCSDNTVYAFMVENSKWFLCPTSRLRAIHEDDLEAMDLKNYAGAPRSKEGFLIGVNMADRNNVQTIMALMGLFSTHYLSYFKQFDGGYVAFGGGAYGGKITGILHLNWLLILIVIMLEQLKIGSLQLEVVSWGIRGQSTLDSKPIAGLWVKHVEYLMLNALPFEVMFEKEDNGLGSRCLTFILGLCINMDPHEFSHVYLVNAARHIFKISTSSKMFMLVKMTCAHTNVATGFTFFISWNLCESRLAYSKEVGDSKIPQSSGFPLTKVGNEAVHKGVGWEGWKGCYYCHSLEAGRMDSGVDFPSYIPLPPPTKKDFSGKVTPLFDSMLVQATKEVGEDSIPATDSTQIPIIDQLSTSSQPKKKKKSKRKQRKEAETAHAETGEEEHFNTPSNDPLPSGEDSMQLNELMVLCTKLQQQVLNLEKLSKSDQCIEFASLKEEEDASKQGRSIEDIDADAEITLVNKQQNEDLMFDTRVLDDDEVFVDVASSEKNEHTAKPKVVTTAATTTTTTRPKGKGVVVQKPSEFRVPQELQPSISKDKGKGIMVKPEVPLKRKDQIALDEQIARDIQAKLDAKLEEEHKLARKQEEEANIALIESW
ncbi:hypothetical protein Tco_1275091 [Tanacetum coccineum]